MHHIEAALRKDRRPVVVLVQDDHDALYARTAARYLTSMVPILHAQTVKPVIIERKPSLWKRARNMALFTSLLIAFSGSSLAYGWLQGNQQWNAFLMQVEKEVAFVDRGPFNRERGQ